MKWARENYHHDVANPYSLRLASADISGRIVVWDVCTATVRAQFADGNRPIAGVVDLHVVLAMCLWVGIRDKYWYLIQYQILLLNGKILLFMSQIPEVN